MTTLREKLRAKGELLLAHAPILTLGCTVGTFLSLATLATATVLSTASQISSTGESTSGASTFGSIESLEVKLGELEVKAIGKNTTEVLQNLLKTVVQVEITPSSRERFYQSMIQKEPAILKKQDSSSCMAF